MTGRLSVALVHGPVMDRHGGVQTTALTNLDVHDLARSTRTYGCAALYIVTPILAQRAQAEAIVGFWEGEQGVKRNKDRTEAMSRVVIVVDVAGAIADETAALGKKPLVVATSAKPQGAVPYTQLRHQLDDGADALILLGTGHGLAPAALEICDFVLAPLLGPDDWNHLSVRSAGAIILDRLRGH